MRDDFEIVFFDDFWFIIVFVSHETCHIFRLRVFSRLILNNPCIWVIPKQKEQAPEVIINISFYNIFWGPPGSELKSSKIMNKLKIKERMFVWKSFNVFVAKKNVKIITILQQNFMKFFRGKKRQKNFKFEKNTVAIFTKIFSLLSHSYNF